MLTEIGIIFLHMPCVTGEYHTVTISSDGVVYSFGDNNRGQLGFGNECNIDISVPHPILSLPKIKQIACGCNFTVCLDYEGAIWSFGKNYLEKLGIIKGIINSKIPQKIVDIPPVIYVACGSYHVAIITNNSELWSTGYNNCGQLCLEETTTQLTFKKTRFSNISRISLGRYHSLFQNEDGEIYSCGSNTKGELGLGHTNHPQIIPTKIPNLPPNIVQFICGYSHNLILDSEGNVLSFGDNYFGQLGLAHNKNQNLLNQIPNIPPIHTISSVGFSSYLIDFDGNIWSFGNNGKGQLGHGDTKNRNVPTKIESLKDIQKISCGPCGYHFFAKDSQNTIFATGTDGLENHGIINSNIPKEMNSKYFTIWGDIQSRCKSARK